MSTEKHKDLTDQFNNAINNIKPEGKLTSERDRVGAMITLNSIKGHVGNNKGVAGRGKSKRNTFKDIVKEDRGTPTGYVRCLFVNGVETQRNIYAKKRGLSVQSLGSYMRRYKSFTMSGDKIEIKLMTVERCRITSPKGEIYKDIPVCRAIQRVKTNHAKIIDHIKNGTPLKSGWKVEKQERIEYK